MSLWDRLPRHVRVPLIIFAVLYFGGFSIAVLLR